MKLIKEIIAPFIITFTIVCSLFAISSFANAKADSEREVGPAVCLYFDVWSNHPVSYEVLVGTYLLKGYTRPQAAKIVSDSTIIYCPNWYEEYK